MEGYLINYEANIEAWQARDEELTHDLASAGAPAWSPDGNAMVFASDRDGDYDIYTMHADGSALEKLTDLPDDEGLPAWSAR